MKKYLNQYKTKELGTFVRNSGQTDIVFKFRKKKSGAMINENDLAHIIILLHKNIILSSFKCFLYFNQYFGGL